MRAILGSRFMRVARLEFGLLARRPMFLMLLAIVILATWGVASGHMRISSGDATVGGNRAWITSEFQNTLLFCYLTLLFFAFFVAVGAGTSIVHDEDLRVGEILHTTGLRPRTYVWGKFTGIVVAFLLVLAVQVVATIVCEHLLPIDDADKIRGPFALANYLKPALGFALPTILFLAGVSFWLGERTRRPVAVFLFPVAVMMLVVFFFWGWNPPWLDPRIEAVLGWLDPSGYRWLNETHIEVDRGVQYYNTQPVRWDAAFALSRLSMVALALGLVALAGERFARNLRGARQGRQRMPATMLATATAPGVTAAGASVAHDTAAMVPEVPALGALSMQVARPGIAAQVRNIARFEFRNLASSAGLYLFIPLILLQTILTAVYADGVWGTRVIVTSGTFAVGTLNTITLCTVLLLLFYTVESLDRENVTRLAPIHDTTSVRTLAVLLGKSVANCFVGVAILIGAGLGALATMAIQGKATPTPWPFVIVWGGLLAPTLFLWTAFVTAVRTLVRNKFTTYGIGLGVLVLTGVLQARGKMNWLGNWNLWNAVRWSDMGLLEPNAAAVLWNRIFAIALGIVFVAIALRCNTRREPDATRIVHRLAPARLLRASLPLLPYAAVAATIAIVLGVQIRSSFQSKPAQRADRDYWKQNLATWRNAPKPGLAGVDVALSLDPEEHAFRTRGTYALVNAEAKPLAQYALTVGRHVKSIAWTVDGTTYEPENRSGLYVFTPSRAFAPGDTVRVGFEFAGKWPNAITRNGGGMREFIQPSGAVLTAFSPITFPLVGWDETMGVDAKENAYEPRRYTSDFWLGTVPPAFGVARPFRTRIELDAPAEYTLNAVGTLVDERVEAGRRHATWVSDEPINLFNVVAGKWAVRRGEGTAIYHHAEHTFNIDEMSWALDGARRHFSEWFAPYPWRELKLSEFANLATYAQGFGTNITFSEGIGFSTLSDARSRAAFMVTAHETAHQWWGNMLVPGEGPGGDILSEGTAHFSTLLLAEEMLGKQGRIEFAKRMEERYDNGRHVDAERPLVQIDGSKEGDRYVTYDKGGWVFWMLHQLMGREANLAGIRAFIANHRDNPDHPLLEDFVAEMRPYAPDPAAFDAFTQQWFFRVVMPEYRFEGVEKQRHGERWLVTGTVQNFGTGRMPLEIAATHGDRFEKLDKDAPLAPAAPSAEYREARAAFELDGGASAPFTIECDFEPALVLVDPDAQVLQLKRKSALHRF